MDFERCALRDSLRAGSYAHLELPYCTSEKYVQYDLTSMCLVPQIKLQITRSKC